MRRSLFPLAVSSSLLLSLVALPMLLASPSLAARVAVFSASSAASPGLTAKEGALMTDATAAAASRAGHDVVTQQQIEALVGLEAARQMVGCSDASCASEIGAALGVDAVVSVGVGTVGQSLVVTLKRTDVKSGLGRVADRRIPKKKGALDAAYDALPALVGDVLAGLPATPTLTTTTTTPTTTTTTPTTTPTTAPTMGAKMPLVRAEVVATPPAGIQVVDDGAGHVIAFPQSGTLKGPLFAGTAKGGLYELRLVGGGESGSDFDVVFWDPRFRDGWQRSFARKGDVFTLQCGDKAISFARPRAATGVRFFAPPWQRQAVLVGRDDQLRYVVVDNSRTDGVKDLRVYLGKKGKLVPLALEVEDDAAFGHGGIIGVGEGLMVKLGPEGGTLTEGAVTSKLAALDLYDSAALIYRELRPWGDLPIGSPCDGR